jgi:cell cycle sensor histidine kinase DivJ
LREDDEGDLRTRLSAAEDRAQGLEIARGRFLAAVSHELRTPLNSIIGFSDMLLHGMAGALEDPRQREYVGLIRQSGGHLLSVVNAILDVSKIESGAYGIQPEAFAVREAIDLCHAMLTPQAEEKGLNFLVRARADAGEIVADRRAVQQIVINLAANAIKFTERGGKVSVEAIRSGGWLRIVVSDTGIGMSQDELARVGKPFVQVSSDLSRRFEGTGLGLSLVKGLVRLHGGTMTIESATGEGTLVTVALPVAGPRAAGGAEIDGGAHEAFRKSA